jgi:hypothetical protein
VQRDRHRWPLGYSFEASPSAAVEHASSFQQLSSFSGEIFSTVEIDSLRKA